ncbi:MAG: hypothetical protein M0Z55_07255 [Peptococcaceae bacterium]|nr:hypothetical protein [Peptococcaceae bacterium]
MDKKSWLFALGGLLLLTTVGLSILGNYTSNWAMYQQKYFQAQINTLQAQLKTTSHGQARAKLEQQITQWQNRKPQIVNLVLPNGQVERCQTCHMGLEEISTSHPPDTFGCTVCHGGNGLSLDLKTAHADWYGQGHPGRLSVAGLTCGGTGPNGQTCHSGNKVQAQNEVDLVKTSLMSTKAGELSFVRRMLGLDPGTKVPNLALGEPASQYPNPLNGGPRQAALQTNCLSQCHQAGGLLPLLQKGKTEIPSNGCENCHVLSNPDHTYVGQDVTISRTEAGLGMVHQLTTQIPYTQCNQCHNQGLHDPIKMKFTPRVDLQQVVKDRQTGNKTWSARVKDYYLPGELFAKCEVSLDCIDCHTREDVMGDGHMYTSEYAAVHIQCQDCHGTINSLPLSKKVRSTSDLAFEEGIANPNFPALVVGDTIGLTHQGEELPYVRQKGQTRYIVSRITGTKYTIPMVKGSACRQKLTEQGADACHACHQAVSEQAH